MTAKHGWRTVTKDLTGKAGHRSVRKRSSNERIMIQILCYLSKTTADDALGFTQHHLMWIQGLPVQNWTRFKAILERLVRSGLLETNWASNFVLFKITPKGQELVENGIDLLVNSNLSS